MATIYNTTTNETTELVMLSDEGIELMDDILGVWGVDWRMEDGKRVYLLDNDGIAWWQTWIDREERIGAAYEACEDEETIAAYWRAIDENQDDLERMQDACEAVLGVGSEWQRNEHGELVRGDGSWLEYGAFGHDTYGLHYVGKPDAVYKVYSELSQDVPSGYSTTQDAERIIKAIEEGGA